MRNQRKAQQSKQQFQQAEIEKREAAQYYSVNANRIPEDKGGYVAKGRLIRNQLSRSNKDTSCDKLKQERSLTPQCHKVQQARRKQAQLEDVQSFKLEQSNLNSKYLTVKKDLKENGSEETKKGVNPRCLESHTRVNPSHDSKEIGNGTIALNEGWTYKGEYNSGLFHGYGELHYLNKVVYKGKFEYGYFHGYGQLHNCELFRFLITMQSVQARMKEHNRKQKKIKNGGHAQATDWLTYLGEFRQGEVSGFGQLWLNDCKIVGCWQKGKTINKSIVLLIETSR